MHRAGAEASERELTGVPSPAGSRNPRGDFSILTAAIAATFVRQDEKPEELRAELREIAERLERIERALGEEERSSQSP